MASKTQYTTLTWVNDETKLNALNMNHLEQGILTNNLLAIENSNYIDEIYSAFIEKIKFNYNPLNGSLLLSVGDLSTARFNVSKNVSLNEYFYNKTQIDLIANNIEQNALGIEDEEYVIPEEDR